MTQTQIGIVLGGLVPATLFGITGLFQKFSANQPIILGALMMTEGIGVLTEGTIISLINPTQSFGFRAAIPSFIVGASWGTGMSLVATAITKYKTPLSQVTPLYNMSTLLTVGAALIVFSEWKDVIMANLLAGTVCIVLGGILGSS